MVDRVIAHDALKWPDARRLMTVPGVNLIVAVTFLAAVGDIQRARARCVQFPKPAGQAEPPAATQPTYRRRRLPVHRAAAFARESGLSQVVHGDGEWADLFGPLLLVQGVLSSTRVEGVHLAPEHFTSTCTFEFDRRGVERVGLSVDPVGNHETWATDIEGARPSPDYYA